MRVDETRLGILVLWAASAVAAYEYVRQRGIFAGEWSHVHTVIVTSAVITFLAVPLALFQGLESLRFRRLERSLRAQRPEAAVTPYEGPEGDGLLFEDALGRVLLLHGVGGWGEPRVVETPAPAPIPHVSETPAPPA